MPRHILRPRRRIRPVRSNRYRHQPRRSLTVLAGAALLATLTAVVSPEAAHASPPPRPHLDHSWYVESTTPKTYDVGCEDGKAATAHSWNVTDILDFGVQDGAGTEAISGVFIPNSRIEAIAEVFAQGFYNCSGGQSMVLAVATNNSVPGKGRDDGAAWGRLVTAIQNSSAGRQVASRVSFDGGNDMEAWDGNGSSAGATDDWLRGFDSTTTAYNIDFGSADGCSTSGYTTGNGYTCNNGYQQSDYWFQTWGEPAALGAPELYNSDQAKQWLWMCEYGYHVKGNAIRYTGIITANTSRWTADQSWNSFEDDVANSYCNQAPGSEILQYDTGSPLGTT